MITALCAPPSLAVSAAERHVEVRVAVRETIEFPVGGVWALVGDFQALPRWTPTLVNCFWDPAPGGGERTAYFPDSWVRERLAHRDARRRLITYSIVGSINGAGVGARVQIAVSPAAHQRTTVLWSAIVPLGAGLNDARQVRQRLTAYYHMRLDQLRAALTSGADDSPTACRLRDGRSEARPATTD